MPVVELLTARKPNALVAETNKGGTPKRPISLVGTERGGALIAFSEGQNASR
jgi:hypothetical protein